MDAATPKRASGADELPRLAAPSSGSLSWSQEADVLVVPSRYEPFGMVVLEGMIAGQAIVAADVDGPRRSWSTAEPACSIDPAASRS